MTGFEPLAMNHDWSRAADADWAEVLLEIPLFSKLGKRQRRRVARKAQFFEFGPGDWVVSTGEPADGFYVILGGEAKVVGSAASRTLGVGDYFGEMALLDGKPRSAAVVATRELHVMRLGRVPFLRRLEQHGGLALTIMAEVGARVRRAEHALWAA